MAVAMDTGRNTLPDRDINWTFYGEAPTACGLVTITTSPGTEDYSFHDNIVEIIEARNPESISQRMIKLI